MNQYAIYLLMLLFLSISCSSLLTQKSLTRMEASKKLQLSKPELNSLILELNVSDSASTNVNEAMQMVRAYNTIGQSNLSGEFYEQFIERINRFYYYRIIDVLEMVKWKTGSSYSKKYEIHLGGPPHENSQYKIIE